MPSTSTVVRTRSSGRRRPRSAASAVAVMLVLAACGGASATAGSGGSSQGGGAAGGASGPSSAPSPVSEAAAEGNEADLAFLTGMIPHHEQAVEMSDIVLAADPPGAVAALATRIRAAQGPEVEQMTAMLGDLGQDAAEGGHGAGHGAAPHGGMLSEAELQRLREATGDDAAHLFLEAMIEHHEGAIEAAETQLADGSYAPARELARSIAQDQAVEIAEMQALLAH